VSNGAVAMTPRWQLPQDISKQHTRIEPLSGRRILQAWVFSVKDLPTVVSHEEPKTPREGR
jgi:hypothetical protein